MSTRDPPQNKGPIQTESEGLEKIFHANGDQKKAGVAILISGKIDFEMKGVKKDNKVNGNGIIVINKYLKCKWVECPNQKTKTG